MTHEDRNKVELAKGDWVRFGEERDEGEIIDLLPDNFIRVLQKLIVQKQGEGRVWTHRWILPSRLTAKGEPTNKAKKTMARVEELEEQMEQRREIRRGASQ